MFHTKDSILDLRKSRKRPHSSAHHDGATAATPLQQLQQLALKKQRTGGSYYHHHGGSTNLPPRATKVRFDLERNTVVVRPHYDSSDVAHAWMSRAEATIVKLAAKLSVQAFQQGRIIDHSPPPQGSLSSSTSTNVPVDGIATATNDCIRGLEVPADPARTEKKLARAHNYTRRILAQQDLLRSLMPHSPTANPHILGKLAVILSANDVHDAHQEGVRDAQAALFIYAQSALSDPVPPPLAATTTIPQPVLPKDLALWASSDSTTTAPPSPRTLYTNSGHNSDSLLSLLQQHSIQSLVG